MNRSVNIFNAIKLHKLNKIYILAFILSIVDSFSGETYLPSIIPFESLIRASIYGICFILFFIRLIFVKPSYFYVIGSFIMIVLSIIIGLQTIRPDVPIIIIMIFAAYNISYLQLVKYFFKTELTFFCFIIFLCFIHILPNMQYARPVGSGIRNSYGFSYPLAFSCFVLVLCISFCIYHYYKISWIDIFLIIIVSEISYHYTLSKSDYYCSIVLISILILYKCHKNIFTYFPFSFAWLSLVIMTVLTFYYAINYNGLNNFYAKFNKNMENRLYYSNYTLVHFHIPILGHFIKENPTSVAIGHYSMMPNYMPTYYIDQSMIKILMKYGIVLFSFILIFYTYRMFKLHLEHFDYFIMLFMVLIIRSFMNDSFWKISYNPFLVILFASLVKITCFHKNKQLKKDELKKKGVNH